jgi:hypothetical protein
MAKKQTETKTVIVEKIDVEKEMVKTIEFLTKAIPNIKIGEKRKNNNRIVKVRDKTLAYIDTQEPKGLVLRTNFVPEIQSEKIVAYRTFKVDGYWDKCKCEVLIDTQDMNLIKNILTSI